MSIDILVILAYFVTIISIGLYVGRKQDSLESYALGNRSLPWWAILASIMAAEISAAGFLGTPGEGLVLRNFAYVQLGIGMILGRIVVGRLFLRPFYRLKVVSIYEYLQQRFGISTRRWASATFLLSRVLASGTRLYVAGILLVIIYRAWTGEASTSPGGTILIYVIALTLITVLTAIYTTLGGLKAVVWTDVIQACVLIIAVASTIGFLFYGIMGDGGFSGAWHTIVSTVMDTSINPYNVEELEPGTVFSTGLGHGGFLEDLRHIISSEYTLWTGVIAATFTAMATMGTDQDMVQRMLAGRNRKSGSLAVILSGVLDPFITVTFLTCGMLVFVYVWKHGLTLPAVQSEAYPYFIVHHMPVGLRGLLIAAVLATAMGSLSTALNALATTATRDWYRDVFRPGATEKQQLRAARLLTVAFAVLLIVVGGLTAWVAVTYPKIRILQIALGIFGYTYGSLLGVFLLGMLTRRRGCDKGNIIAMVAGFIAVIALEICGLRGITPVIAFPWRVTIGTLVTFAVGCLFPTPAASQLREALPRQH